MISCSWMEGTFAMIEWGPEDVVEALEMYVVYSNPLDYPGKFVVRQWSVATVLKNGERFQDYKAHVIPLTVVDTLDEAREAVPGECVNIGRYDQDDLAIYEVWV
ncbi:MAG TPA: hypothetical protein VK789_28400 [Bryobacteraceae bacterium]|nr:hypothetical protein [Bryobacteraceae bacterium]